MAGSRFGVVLPAPDLVTAFDGDLPEAMHGVGDLHIH